MDSQTRFDGFNDRLAAAREVLLANVWFPSRAVEPFEPILEEIHYGELKGGASTREEKLARVRSLGRQLFAELRSEERPIAMEVRHYCWHLQHLGDPAGSPASSVKDLFMATLTRFVHYEDHDSARCSICAEFPDDVPFQGSPDGRDHFNEWLARRTGEGGGFVA